MQNRRSNRKLNANGTFPNLWREILFWMREIISKPLKKLLLRQWGPKTIIKALWNYVFNVEHLRKRDLYYKEGFVLKFYHESCIHWHSTHNVTCIVFKDWYGCPTTTSNDWRKRRNKNYNSVEGSSRVEGIRRITSKNACRCSIVIRPQKHQNDLSDKAGHTLGPQSRNFLKNHCIL